MKKFILSILCALQALLFAAVAHATVFTTTLELTNGQVSYSSTGNLSFGDDSFRNLHDHAVETGDHNAPYSLIAAVDWSLDPNPPGFDEWAVWDLQYEYGFEGQLWFGENTEPMGIGGGDSDTIPLGEFMLSDIISEDDFNDLLVYVDGFITGSPYSDENFGLLYFDTDGSLLNGTVLAALESEPTQGLLSYLGAEGLTGADIVFGGKLELVAETHAEVPEPSTLALLGIGLLGFGIRRRLTH